MMMDQKQQEIFDYLYLKRTEWRFIENTLGEKVYYIVLEMFMNSQNFIPITMLDDKDAAINIFYLCHDKNFFMVEHMAMSAWIFMNKNLMEFNNGKQRISTESV